MQHLKKLSSRSLTRLPLTNNLYGKSHLTSVLEQTSMHVFFLVDTSFCKTEDDDPKDAIIYFYPPQVPESQLCALCCQMTGAVQFFRTTFSPPKVIRLSRGKFAIKLVGSYLFSLGSSSDMPDIKLIESLDFLYEMFTFYHCSLDFVRELCLKTETDFSKKIQLIWKFFLESACSDEKVSWIAEIIPRVHNILPSVYLSAFHVLQACQRLPQVLAGCIVHNNFIVSTQLTPKISSYLCHFHDEVLKTPESEQVEDLIVTRIYLSSKDMAKICSMNAFSKTFKKPWYVTDFSTEASLTGESNKTEVSEVDSSFEDCVVKNSNLNSPFMNQTLLKSASSDNFKTKGESSTWFTKSMSESIKLTLNDEHDISQSFDSAVKKDPKLEQLKLKSNSLSVLQSVAEESLRRLKLYETNNNHPRYKKKKSKKLGIGNNSMFFSDGHESKTESAIDAAAHSENSADSSFFEPKILSESDIPQQVNHGNVSPVILKLSQDLTEIATPKRKKVSRTLNFPSIDDTTIQTMDLYCIKFQNTTCFLLMEPNSKEVAVSIHKMCFKSLQNLNSAIIEAKPATHSSQKPVTALYCDHIWNASVGAKISKNHRMNDLQDNPSFKSITVMNMSGVAYMHSSMTHNIYVDNNSSGSSVSGIPSPQDVMARISHLPKQKHDKLGYFLLK